MARTSKHIFVFAFEPLFLNFSSRYILRFFTLFIFICQIQFVCAHTCVEPRELLIAPQLLIQRNHEEQLQSPSWRIQTHSWLHIVCQQISFKFRIICPRLASIPIPLSLSALSIGIRPSAPDIGLTTQECDPWIANLDLLLHTYCLYTHGFSYPSHV